MASYASDARYDFSLFEESSGSAARAVTASAVPAPEAPAPRTPAQRPAPSRNAQPVGGIRPAVKAAVCLLIAVVTVAACAFMLNLNAKKDELNDEIKTLSRQIEYEKIDSITLDNKLDSMFSKKEVVYYAEQVLGMIKLDTYSTIHIKLPKTNTVVIADGKQVAGVVNTSSPLAPAADTAQMQSAADG
ncbi:MAG: hypothetical protein IJ766_07665 [Clostridia bacterium]|nr:hypothetical protein [Clostridia bacterium]